jgi:TonB family protein
MGEVNDLSRLTGGSYMNPVNALRNSLFIRLLFIIMACLSLIGFAATGAACSAQRSPADDIREATVKAKRALRGKSLRIRVEGGCGDQHGITVIEVARSGDSHTIEEGRESITIGGDVYERKGDGPWEKESGNQAMTADVTRFTESSGTRSLKSNEELRLIGPDTLDNVPVLVYQYTKRDPSDNRILITNKYLIGAQDGLLHRTELTEAVPGEPAAPPCKMTTTYYDFNAEIVIEPPSRLPAKVATETNSQILDEQQRQPIQQAADAWLKFMDAGKFAESWEAAAQCLKAKADKGSWTKIQGYLAEATKELGAVKSRKLQKAILVKSLPGMPDRARAVLEYDAVHEKAGPIRERVELVLEQDQVWRVAGYQATEGQLTMTTVSGSISLGDGSSNSLGPGPGGGPGPSSGGGPGSGGGIGPGSGVPGRGFNTSSGSNPNAPVTSVDVKPIPLTTPSPRYTDAARKNKVQGTVRVRVLVGADGSVKQVRMMRGLPDGLEEEAIREAYRLRFKPAMKGGQPVPFWMPIDIEFNLR